MQFKTWLINEEIRNVDGLDDVIERIKSRHPNIQDSLVAKIKEFVAESGVKKIQIKQFALPALGASLIDRVLLNTNVLNSNLSFILYVLFHEIAHQYQYKKYGFGAMWLYFNDDITAQEAIKKLRRIENVADTYAIRKLKKIQASGEKIDASGLHGYYASMPDSNIISYINLIKKMLKDAGSKDPNKISEALYNLVMTRMTGI